MTDSPNATRMAVRKYLDHLEKSCPTPGCFQNLNHHPTMCKRYHFRWYTFKMIGDRLKSVSMSGYAISTSQICDILKHSNYLEKSKCRNCESGADSPRETLNGVFCQGCGFFIDYNRGHIGYAQEWTTSDNLKLPLGILGQKECTACRQPTVSAKFADYYFCSHNCLDHWLSDISARHVSDSSRVQ